MAKVEDFGLIFAYQFGKVIAFKASGTISGQYGVIATIASGYRPAGDGMPILAYYNSGGYEVPTYAIARANGDIYVVNKGSSDKETTVYGMYMI